MIDLRAPRLASAAAGLVPVLALLAAAPPAAADKEAEKAAIKACEKSLCTVAVSKKADGDIKCELSKTWTKSDINEGVQKAKLSWSFGDARCVVPLVVPSQPLVDGMTKPGETLTLPSQIAKCEIDGAKEGEKAVTVNVALAPSFEFKDGKVVKVKLNVGTIDAPSAVKGAIWTAASAEDYFGLFQGQLITALNKLLGETCPKNHPAQ